MQNNRWFKITTTDTGWHWKDPAKVRRAKARRAHKTDLATGRSLQALANVMRRTSPEVSETARKDATFFFKQHRTGGVSINGHKKARTHKKR